MNIYLAGPLFNDSERATNKVLASHLREAGYDVYLPQEQGILSDGVNPEKLFNDDLRALAAADIVVAVTEGVVTDPGTCWEIGFAYARQKLIFAYSTDSRIFEASGLNNMLERSFQNNASNIRELLEILPGR